ncbi:ABC transporter permease [Chitinophaga arvensicola]|uniref:Duplicated orphan permease n=1 Tax=Chitinophaga arvensicola TaxID=29529 RepID=A0A1I0NWL3_9BACT|nr:ABC transporter permease [Chitinophaga arvensicola]SEW06189.1 duplicated orphan permease [Chitinophaga arvensicola]
MIKNYFRIAWRNLKRSRFFAAINIAGLAFGMAICMFILCWVLDEYNVDKFHTNGKNIYRLQVNVDWGGIRTMGVTPYIMGEQIKSSFPEITANVNIRSTGNNVVFRTAQQMYLENKYVFASPNILEEMDFPLLAGNKHTALTQPDAIVLTASFAKKIYGSTDIIGKIVTINDNQSLQVTGIAKDVPAASSMQFDFILPFARTLQEDSWLLRPGSYSVTNYMVVKAGTDIPALTTKMQRYFHQQYPDRKDQVWLQPFEDVYLHEKYENGKVAGGRIEYVRLFFITALIVLAIACINFMNLSTAQASKRAREVGVRKAMGASRMSLIGQFTGEAILMCAIAALSAAVVVYFLMPVFNNFTGKHIAFTLPVIGKYLLGVLAVILVTGLLAGSYPAFVLSRFLPVKVLKGDLSSGSGASIFRKNLVVLQFVLSFIFIVGSVVIYSQMQYIYHRNLGIDRENIMYVSLDDHFESKRTAVEQSLAQLPQVKSFTYNSFLPLSGSGSSADLSWEGKPEKLILNTAPQMVGYDYATTMGISMKEGRDFSRDFASDSAAYIINETAARVMGMAHPIGKQISFWRGKGTIIGVVKDYHFNSLRENITPMVIMLQPKESSYMMLRLGKGEVAGQVAAVEKIFTTLNPGYPVDYHFLDETFDNMYQSETMLRKLAQVFAVVAVLISCLGLFGLSVFTAEQRKKEIGIRKILGASVMNVTSLLSREFLTLVIIGILLATPVSWYMMNNWLSGFAYHTDLSAWIFIIAGVLAVLIALATVSYQSIKAALSNPVTALKAE